MEQFDNLIEGFNDLAERWRTNKLALEQLP